MCGIAGLVAIGGDRSDGARLARSAQSMAETLEHRGPDDSGVWTSADGLAAFAHRRLSIVDLSPLGRNPMLWDDGRLAITFNGEIYNFLELRRELEEDGVRFRSHTDTEVILASYDRWGLECVHRFAGMFAFGLWDSPRQRLWLVRDRIGKKPLYYSTRNGRLAFSSELKGLLADETLPRVIDREALRLYLRYGYVPAPFTIYQHARKLEPAHSLLCEGGRVSITRYWDPLKYAGALSGISEGEAEQQLESLLATAVGQRLIADVPLGAFLSGGIDSSLVVALMSELSRTPVKTFTIRFTNPAFNEADHAAAVARHLGTDHHESLCDERQMLDLVDRMPDIFDEPFADSSAIPTYLVSQAARRGVTVALSGDGGDELFFGYPRYRYDADGGWVFNLPRPVRQAAARVSDHLPGRRVRRIGDVLRADADDPYSRFVTWTSPELIERLSGERDHMPPIYGDMLRRSAKIARANRSGLLDLVSYLPDDILAKVDRTSMAVSLEVRAPLLDHRVIEFAVGLPIGLKRRGATTKWLLRKLLFKRVPAALVERPKMGFGVPLADWLRGPLRERMDDAVRGDGLQEMGLDPAPIRTMWSEFKNGRWHRPDVLWQILMLVSWSRRSAAARSAA